jgi:ubiquinone/menaquinone biosynthesis C-methylase UbiE
MPPSDNLQLDTADYFTRLAATYGAGEYYRKRREAALAEIHREIGGVDSLLDLGCGNGTYLAGFRARGMTKLLVGGDLSLGMLHEARRRGAASVLLSCDATVLPFRSACFEAIFCSHVLQFVVDLAQCLGEISRCLRPGGTFIAAGGEFGVRERLKVLVGDQRWAQFAKELPRPRDVHVRRGLIEYRQAAESAGLVVDQRKVEFSGSWADLAEFYRVRWLPLLETSARVALSAILIALTTERGNEPISLTESLLFCRKPLR